MHPTVCPPLLPLSGQRALTNPVNPGEEHRLLTPHQIEHFVCDDQSPEAAWAGWCAALLLFQTHMQAEPRSPSLTGRGD